MFARDGSVRAYALVDEDCYDALARYRWHFARGYAQRLSLVSEDGLPRRRIAMHRQVLGLPAGDRRHVDHINRDRLDNRRENLRFSNAAENRQNQSARGAASKFRGVIWDKGTSKWIARVQLNGRPHHVGRFRSELAAALEAEALRQRLMPLAQPDPELVQLDLA